MFNIINNKIQDAVVLDLFAGSGAIGIEFLSRGCKKAYLCDKSREAIKFVKDNVNKTKLNDKAIIVNKDYNDLLKELRNEKEKFDIIFLDPPYELDIAKDAVDKIIEYKLLADEGIIIIETDQKEREIKNLEKMKRQWQI